MCIMLISLYWYTMMQVNKTLSLVLIMSLYNLTINSFTIISISGKVSKTLDPEHQQNVSQRNRAVGQSNYRIKRSLADSSAKCESSLTL
jgi:hypothetical protein